MSLEASIKHLLRMELYQVRDRIIEALGEEINELSARVKRLESTIRKQHDENESLDRN